MTTDRPIHRSSAALAAVAALAILAAPRSAAAQSKSDAFAGKIPPVAGQLYQKKGRVELTATGNLSLNDAFFNKYFGGAKLGYHLTEYLSLAASFATGTTKQTGSAVVCPSNGGCGDATKQQLWQVPGDLKMVTGLEVAWAPIYGKLNIFSEKVAHFDLSVLAGGDWISHQEVVSATRAAELLTLGQEPGTEHHRRARGPRLPPVLHRGHRRPGRVQGLHLQGGCAELAGGRQGPQRPPEPALHRARHLGLLPVPQPSPALTAMARANTRLLPVLALLAVAPAAQAQLGIDLSGPGRRSPPRRSRGQAARHRRGAAAPAPAARRAPAPAPAAPAPAKPADEPAPVLDMGKVAPSAEAQSRLTAAKKLLDEKATETAALAFDRILREPSLRSVHDEARYQLGKALARLGLHHSALTTFDAILEKGPQASRFYGSSMEWLFYVGRRLDNEHPVLSRVAKHARDAFPPGYEDKFHFLLAKYEFERGRALQDAGRGQEAQAAWAEARRLVSMVREQAGAASPAKQGEAPDAPEGDLFAKARFVDGLVMYASGDDASAIEAFKQVVRITNPKRGRVADPELREQAFLQLARIHYQAPAEPLRHLLLREDAVGRRELAGGAVGGVLRPLPHRRLREDAREPAHAPVPVLQGRVLPRVLHPEVDRLLRELPLPRGALGPRDLHLGLRAGLRRVGPPHRHAAPQPGLLRARAGRTIAPAG